MKSISGSRTSTGSPSRSSNFVLIAAADDLLGRDAVDPLGPRAHELDAAAGDDVRLEAVRAQVGEQLEHRLVDQLGVGPLESRVLGRREPVVDDLVELFGRHAGVRGGDQFDEPLLARRERRFHVALEDGLERLLVFHSGCCRRERLDAVEGERDWTYIGCSDQSVPSLSKTAMRSAGGR